MPQHVQVEPCEREFPPLFDAVLAGTWRVTASLDLATELDDGWKRRGQRILAEMKYMIANVLQVTLIV